MNDESQEAPVMCQQPGCGRELTLATGGGGYVFYVHKDTMMVACRMGWAQKGINCYPRTPGER